MARWDLVKLPVQKLCCSLARRLPGPDMAVKQPEYGIALPTGQAQQLLMQCLYYDSEREGSLAVWVSRQVVTQIRMLAGQAIDRESSWAGCTEKVGLGGENGLGFGFSM